MYARPNQLDVLKGNVIPWCQNCSNDAVEQGLGIVGAVIMPHNLYLHSGLVLVRGDQYCRATLSKDLSSFHVSIFIYFYKVLLLFFNLIVLSTYYFWPSSEFIQSFSAEIIIISKNVDP